MNFEKINALRMERQHFTKKANIEEYVTLYQDLQPGQNVYWNGFGQPPTLSFRAEFDDIEFNRMRQKERKLIKGRFSGGNLGWITPENLELFIALYRKPLKEANDTQRLLLSIIKSSGPLNIQQMKEETGLLVKEITPALHRLQEAFLIYEDQYDGEWDRGWYVFSEVFPDTDADRYTRHDALKIVLQRFAYRFVHFTSAMAKSFYKLPEKEIKAAILSLEQENILASVDDGYMLKKDISYIETYNPEPMHFIYAIHRNDPLYKANEPKLKAWAKSLTEGLPYDAEPLQYILIDGEFRAASVGHFRNGPYDLNDIVCDLDDPESRKQEIIDAMISVNYEKAPLRFMGTLLTE